MVADGFEIAVHSVTHPLLETLSDQIILNEILEDKRALEKLTGKIITGMAYPFGTYDNKVIEIAKNCGIKYSRTTKYNGYLFPSDFMEWHSTCHHRDMAKFIPLPNEGWRRILYVWGHSYEFNTEELWSSFEENLKQIAFKDDVWYATNGEICEYTMAQKSLVFSADLDMVYNPTAIDVWILVNDVKVEVKAGQTLSI
jgi:peptidoglycan/xylan/chitin deacetylase (PgdA/CDA1 family)